MPKPDPKVLINLVNPYKNLILGIHITDVQIETQRGYIISSWSPSQEVAESKFILGSLQISVLHTFLTQ